MLLPIVRRLTSIFSLAIIASAFAFAVWTGVTWLYAPVASETAQTQQVATAASMPAPKRPSNLYSRKKFATVGDRLQLEFYERLIDEEQTWTSRRQTRKPPKSFQLRSELTGEYDVKEDGTIVLPLLGPIKVQDQTMAEFENDVSAVFERLIGRFAFVSVTVEPKPIYVVGPVKKPGPQKFTAGMTVLHAIALAGDIDRANVDVGYMLRAVQEAGSQQKNSDHLKRLWARLSVLEAERDGKHLVIPATLVALVGEPYAKSVVDAEKSLRSLALESRDAQLASLDASRRAIQAEIGAKKARAGQVAQNVDLRAERVGAIRSLRDNGRRSYLVQAESELSDVKERLHEANASVDDAESKLQQLEKTRLMVVNQSRMDLEREILTLKSQITETANSVSTNEGTLEAMRSIFARGEGATDGNVEFEIVRAGSPGRSVFRAQGTDELKPGDLVKVKIGKAAAMNTRLFR